MTGATATDPDERRGLSVVVPAFNEERHLEGTLQRIAEFLHDQPLEILVVDDGSGDRTAAIASSFPTPPVRLIQLGLNRGKGAAIKAGILASRQPWVLLCDADLATPIEDLERLWRACAEVPIAIGSRLAPAAVTSRCLKRRIMADAFRQLRRCLGLCPQVLDTQCGFKLLQGSCARRLAGELTVNRFAFDVELLELARADGLSIREVGVHWDEVDGSSVRPFRDAASMVKDLFALRRRLRCVTRDRSTEPGSA